MKKISVTKRDYETLLDAENLNYYPKTVGNPSQFMVHSFDELWEFYTDWVGDKSVYACHNSFPELKVSHGKEMPSKIQLNNVLNDFDSDKIENAHLDTIRLSTWLRELNIDHTVNFTAGKGFHLLIKVKSMIFNFVTESERNNLSKLVYGVQRTCQKKLKLRTIDEKCMKDVRKIMRLPYTYHYNRFGEASGRYCIPIDKDMLKWNVTKIKEFSLAPDFFVPEPNGEILSIEDICFRIGVDFEDLEEEINSTFVPISETNIEDKDASLYLELVSRHKPCIANAMKDINPNHFMRVAFALYLKKIGISASRFKYIYYKIADEVGYVDSHNREYGEYQIESIFNNPRYQKEPSCSKIKMMGFCLGGCSVCRGKRGVCKHGKCLRYRG